jgi:hypothetical protein
LGLWRFLHRGAKSLVGWRLELAEILPHGSLSEWGLGKFRAEPADGEKVPVE